MSVVAVSLKKKFLIFQAKDDIRYAQESRGLGDVYKRQKLQYVSMYQDTGLNVCMYVCMYCFLYTSDAADERSSVDVGGRRIIKKKIFNFSSKRRHTICSGVSWARRCV